MHLFLYGNAGDDAYIHFRIARNLLNYGKPYFNLDERVMSSSSTGWTITLFLLFWVFGVSIKAVACLNAIITTVTVFVYARIAQKLTGRNGIIYEIASVLVILPVIILPSIGLMETSAALLLAGIGLFLYLRKKSLSFLFLSVSCFFRLELVILFFVMAGYNFYKKDIPIKKMLFFSFLGVGPFLIYNMYFFGTNIPQPVYAKSVVYSLNYREAINFAIPGMLLNGRGKIYEFFLIVFFSVMFLVDAIKSQKKEILLLLSPGFLLLLAYVLKRVIVFGWYPPLFILPIFLSFLIIALNKKNMTIAAFLLLFLMPYLNSGARYAYAAVFDRTAYPFYREGAKVKKYIATAERLNQLYPGCNLMASEIGGLGYEYQGKIYDGVGLISKGALKYHPLKVPEERRSGLFGAIPPGYAEEVKPDIIVTYECFGEALLGSKVIESYFIFKEDNYLPDYMKFAKKEGHPEGKEFYILIKKDICKGI